jgi:general secretion pathway protein D
MSQRVWEMGVTACLMVGVIAVLGKRGAAQSPGSIGSQMPLPTQPALPTSPPPPLQPASSPFLFPARPDPGQVPWGKGTYAHVAVDQSLVDLLREFANDQGLNLIVSAEVTKSDVRISGSFPAQAPETFLNKVTHDNGLIWYYDGTSIYVYRNDELKSRFFSLANVEPDAVAATLEKIGVPLGRFTVRYLPRERLLYVVGAPRLVELIEEVIKTLQGAKVPTAAPEAARQLQSVLLQLNYVRAVDVAAVVKPLLSKDGVITVTPPAQEGLGFFGYGGMQGVTSSPFMGGMLGGVFGGGFGGGIGGLGGYGGTAGSTAGGTAGTSGQVGMGTGTSAMSAYLGPTPITGGNSLSGLDAIIIKDYPENLVAILDSVRRLDCQPLQILIEAVILRVQLTEGQTLGVDFAAVNNQANMANVSGNALDLNAAAGISGRVLSPAAPYNGSAPSGYQYLGNRHGQLVAGYLPANPNDLGYRFGYSGRNVESFIQALETMNKVDVMASPRLLVLNKQLATVQLGNRLGYQQSVTNFPTTYNYVQFLNTGTLLLLRPYVTTDGMVRMEIHPERSDGSIGTNGLPSASVSELTTNVMVPDGATIVIGGLLDSEETLNEAGVLGLSRLPVVGPLFRNRQTSAIKTELVVLLTPRIVRRDGLPPPVPGVVPHNPSGVPGSGPMPGPSDLPPLPGEGLPVDPNPSEIILQGRGRSSPTVWTGPAGGNARGVPSLPSPAAMGMVAPQLVQSYGNGNQTGIGPPRAAQQTGGNHPPAATRPVTTAGRDASPTQPRGYRPGDLTRAAASAIVRPFSRRPTRDPEVQPASAPNR